jgi:MFS transporter, DHA3 family, tetracycline resistance protein
VIRPLPPIPVYYLIQGISSFFWFMLTTAGALYAIQIAHLSPVELVLVGTALEVSALIFEVPTGVLADAVSRRLSVIVGTVIMGIGFILWGAIPVFGWIIVAQVVWAIGVTFTSGATEAWVADESGQKEIGRTYLRGSQIGYGAGAVGIGAAVLIGGSFGLQWPLLVAGAGHLALAVFLAGVMTERHFTPEPRGERTRRQAYGSTFSSGLRLLRGSPVLLTIVSITAIAGAASEAFDRLWEFHLLDHFSFPAAPALPLIAWFGLINISALLLGVAAIEVTRRWIQTDTHVGAARSLLAIDATLMVALVVFGLAGNIGLAVSAYLTARMLRRLAAPIRLTWINQGLTTNVRATVISMDSQADALGQIAGGPLLGWIAGGFGTRVAMVVVSLLLTPALYLYARTLRKRGHALVETAEA